LLFGVGRVGAQHAAPLLPEGDALAQNLRDGHLDVRIGIDALAETSFNDIHDPFLSFLEALERGCFHKLYSFEAVATCLPNMLLDGIFMR